MTRLLQVPFVQTRRIIVLIVETPIRKLTVRYTEVISRRAAAEGIMCKLDNFLSARVMLEGVLGTYQDA